MQDNNKKALKTPLWLEIALEPTLTVSQLKYCRRLLCKPIPELPVLSYMDGIVQPEKSGIYGWSYILYGKFLIQSPAFSVDKVAPVNKVGKLLSACDLRVSGLRWYMQFHIFVGGLYLVNRMLSQTCALLSIRGKSYSLSKRQNFILRTLMDFSGELVRKETVILSSHFL